MKSTQPPNNQLPLFLGETDGSPLPDPVSPLFFFLIRDPPHPEGLAPASLFFSLDRHSIWRFLHELILTHTAGRHLSNSQAPRILPFSRFAFGTA